MACTQKEVKEVSESQNRSSDLMKESNRTTQFVYCYFCDRKFDTEEELEKHIPINHKREYRQMQQAKNLKDSQFLDLEITHKEKIKTSQMMLQIYRIERNRRCDLISKEYRESLNKPKELSEMEELEQWRDKTLNEMLSG